jgi:hypothetical protein
MTLAEEWDTYCREVANAMQLHVLNFITPLALSEKPCDGVSWGSGTYIKNVDSAFVLTASHVAAGNSRNTKLSHLPFNGSDFFMFEDQSIHAEPPIDAAALPISSEIAAQRASNRFVPLGRVGQKFEAITDERLFFMGFPAYAVARNEKRNPEKQNIAVNQHMTSNMLSVLCHAVEGEFKDFQSNLHLAVSYEATAKRNSDNAIANHPNPAGLSGSALWDTKAYQCWCDGTPWSPEKAEICGVVWGVPKDTSHEVLFATKIEHVRSRLEGVF